MRTDYGGVALNISRGCSAMAIKKRVRPKDAEAFMAGAPDASREL